MVIGGIMRFDDMGISPFFVEKLSRRNINEPTEIQKLVIPRILNGENTLFRSATGTGKTFAYLLPLFERLCETESAPSPRILIVAPTLELCSQIKQEADFLFLKKRQETERSQDTVPESTLPQNAPRFPDPKVSLIIGSANMSRQIDALKKEKPAVIVGNTARILQLARMNKLKLNKLEVLMLDEADRLTSDEMLDETKALVELINPKRQVIACSATIPAKTRERLRSLFGEMVFLETEEQEILRKMIEHWAFFSENRKKVPCLCSFLEASHAKKALVFTGNTGQVGNITAQLQHHKIGADGLFSGMDKQARRQAVDTFKQGKLRVLVSSDLAARGLDIPDIDYVISLDVPFEPDAYIHRAGRTGRAGKRGRMITIGDEDELRRFSLLEKKLGITVYPKAVYGGRIEEA
jgi:superfamily II DNA/RNA helicase